MRHPFRGHHQWMIAVVNEDLWTSRQWRDAAVGWADERLAAVGLVRTGPATQPRVRPWGTVLRIPTDGGTHWLKAPGPGTRFEVALYPLLARVVPEHVLSPVGTDPARGLVLLPDGGPDLRSQAGGEGSGRGLAEALVRFGDLQRRLAPHVDELLAAGVADMRPAAMPARFEEALDVSGATGELRERLEALRPEFGRWCAELECSALGPSLDHNDLHPGNVLAGPRYYDWGDAVVAHPFAVALVPLPMLDADGSRAAARDAYLAGFADLAPGEDLVATLDTACRVATAARALVWARAIEGSDRWRDAPLRTLESLLPG